MASLFPRRSEVGHDPTEPRVVALDGEDADAVFSALSSPTTRDIYVCLSEEPATASDLADAVDTSIQNVRYHVDKLQEAGLVDVVDTWYSSRGKEMKVYGAEGGPLIVAGNETRASRVKQALGRLLSGTVLVGLASVALHYALKGFLDPPTVGGGAGGGGGGGGDAASAPATTAAEAGGDGGDGGGLAAQDTETDVGFTGGETDTGTYEVADVTTTGAPADTATRTATEAPAGTPAPSMTETAAPTGTSTETVADTQTATETATNATAETTRVLADGGSTTADAAGSLPPAALFFAGGMLALVMATTYWYYTAR